MPPRRGADGDTRLGYFEGERWLLRCEPHQESGTKVVLTTQKPERDPH